MDEERMTQEQIEDAFLERVRLLIDFWEREPDQTTRGRLEGLAFSICSALDGCAPGVPPLVEDAALHERLLRQRVAH